MRIARAIKADAPLFPTEPPQYPNLGAAIGSVWRISQRQFRLLRRRWFGVIGVSDPVGRGARQERLLRQIERTRRFGRLYPRKALSDDQIAALDGALEEFLRGYAGEERTESGFVNAEGSSTLHQAEFLAYDVGVTRGRQLAGTVANVQLTDAAKEALLRDAFARMSEGGRLRFEARLDEIRQAMVDGFESGASPLEIARRLAADCDSFERARLETITRTEMGLASEQGIRDLYREAGINRVEVIGDPNADEACAAHIGNTYAVGDLENLPIYHPNCLCSTVPVVENS